VQAQNIIFFQFLYPAILAVTTAWGQGQFPFPLTPQLQAEHPYLAA